MPLTLQSPALPAIEAAQPCKEYFAIFNVAYKLVIGFAAVGIINAVFIQVSAQAFSEIFGGRGGGFRQVVEEGAATFKIKLAQPL